MSAWKFYGDEWKRHPIPSHVTCSREEAEAAIRKLTRHYFGNHKTVHGYVLDPKTKPIVVEFKRAGSSWGHAHGSYKIRLPDQGFAWNLVVHEFAHIYEVRKYGSTSHRKRMARVVDRIHRYVAKKGWVTDSLDRQFSVWCMTQIETPAYYAPAPVEQMAACPLPPDDSNPDTIADVEHDLTKEAKRIALDARIAKRETQVKRLTKKAKAIATRLKKADRSLKALQRSRARLAGV